MSQSKMDLVASKARELASHSWEYGVVSEALLELYNPELSFFSQQPPIHRSAPRTPEYQAVGLEYAQQFISTDEPTLADGEGSAGDPASLGHAALLLSHFTSSSKYLKAAERQKDILLNGTPRHENGAISHRVKVVELWSDFIYQAPPFLAFYAYVHEDERLLDEAIRQCLLYRDILQDTSTGLWKHVVGPEKEDLGRWSTGNGWVVTGMVRVLAIFKRYRARLGSENSLLEEREEALEKAITEILEACFKAELDEGGLVRNYIDDKTWFGENAGTAAIASAAYRMAVLSPHLVSTTVIEWAERRRERVWGNIGADGAISPVVNPMNSHDRMPIGGSAEGQAFGMFLYAAHRDWLSSWSEA